MSVNLIPKLCPGIENDYQGPRFEDGGVTLKFVTDLMKTFKEQKKLHRKYAYQVGIKYIYLLSTCIENLWISFLLLLNKPFVDAKLPECTKCDLIHSFLYRSWLK